MAGLFDLAITVAILLFLALVVWSRIMNQTMYQTAIELRDILKDIFFTEVAE